MKFEGMYTIQSIGTFFAIASFVGLAAGLYPSVVLSCFKPVNILKGQAGDTVRHVVAKGPGCRAVFGNHYPGHRYHRRSNADGFYP